jgi:hypothetical protein
MKTTRLLALTVAPLTLALAPSLASAMTPDAVTAAVSSATPTAESGPPVLHVRDVLSNGSERLDRLNHAYTDCLIENGAPTIDPSSEPRPVPASNISEQYGVTLAWPPPADARQACADFNPVYPPALGAATNPAFAAQAQTYVACLQSHGEWVRLLNDQNLDWTYRAGHDVPDDNARIEDDCLVGTFGSE